jgi:hypothetical protein
MGYLGLPFVTIYAITALMAGLAPAWPDLIPHWRSRGL